MEQATETMNMAEPKSSASLRSSVAPCYAVLDLFSGIGGFSLGLERAGGFKTIAFCEWEEHARNILRKHWPDVPIFNDVRTLNAEDLPEIPDIICGGFPCQDLSCAGKMAGIEGERSGLYKEVLRLVMQIRPQFAILENVSNLLNGGGGKWFGRFLGDLAEIGYNAEWHCIPASILGAPHIRDRVWVIAYPQQRMWEGIRIPNSFDVGKLGHEWTPGEIMPLFSSIGMDCKTDRHNLRGDDGFSEAVDRLERLGNAVVPQVVELLGRCIRAV